MNQRSTGMNPGINVPNQAQWPTHQRQEFRALVTSNYNRILKMADEQFDHFQAMEFNWLDYTASYPDVPAALAEARACRDVLNLVQK